MNELFESIQQHLSLLDLALNSSANILFLASNQETDLVITETENRERLINVISELQHHIEQKISALNPVELQGDSIMILKSWFADLSIWSDKLIEMDKATVEYLNQQKEDTTKEIANIFKNKESHKGYSQSLKK
jgi:hypothetical protein